MPDLNFAKKAVVKVQKRSAFDKSFRNLLTTKCGTLTPILCDELIPNTTVNLKIALNATLPPLASETFMNVNLKAEAFWCPSRLVMCGFEEFIQGNTDIKVGNSFVNATDSKLRVPVIKLTGGNANTTPYVGAGTLSDYLGLKIDTVVDSAVVKINAMPYLCYHLIADTWYRNTLVQKSAFDEVGYQSTSAAWYPVNMKYRKPCESASVGYETTLSYQFRDGVRLGDLRQRNFGSDYFTMATPSPQNGSAQKITMDFPSSIKYSSIDPNTEYLVTDSDIEWSLVPSTNDDEGFTPGGEIGVNTSSTSGVSFTISSLRACNALQQWLERNQLSSNQYVSFLKAQYNANLQDSIAQRPVYLGSASFPVYSKGVYQTARDSNFGNNPFDSVGSRYGHAYAEGSSFIIDHFTAEEPGYLMVLVSLVPEVTYSSGINKMLMRYTDADSYGEMANPILQNVGPEPIHLYEFDYQINDDDSFGVFGYVDRFASWMTKNSELHGLMRDGQSLESFALQRSGVSDGIGDTFLRIPTNYMDQVTAVDSAISSYGVWIDSWLDYKVVQPLGKYVIPSLQDPAYEHGDSVVVNRRGRYLD